MWVGSTVLQSTAEATDVTVTAVPRYPSVQTALTGRMTVLPKLVDLVSLNVTAMNYVVPLDGVFDVTLVASPKALVDALDFGSGA